MQPRLSIQWSLRLLFAGAAAVVLSGCVGITPIPVYSSKPEYGQKRTYSQIRFIQPGQTTRAEVLAALGTNCVDFRGTRSVAYTSEMCGGGGVWWVAAVVPPGAVARGGNWVGGWRGFLVAFDERDVVRTAEFKKLSARRSLDVNMERWLATLPPVPPAIVPIDPPRDSGVAYASPLPPRRW